MWAKYAREANDASLPLAVHMADSGGVAERLWDHWLSPHLRGLVAEAIGDPEDARTVVIWLAAVHDIGKASPAFVSQVPLLKERIRTAGLTFPDPVDSRRAPHSIVSHLVLERWLVARGWNPTTATSYAIVPGGHHGAPPDDHALQEVALRTDHVGEGPWVVAQDELLDFATEITDAARALDRARDRPLPKTVQMIVTGLVIMADWIASSADHFPLAPDNHQLDNRVDAAWQRLGLVAPWTPTEPAGDADELFHARFDLPHGVTLRPVQRAAIELARSGDPHRLLIVEAPMGEGKTELALLVAEILAARAGCGGVGVALPTMATSDGMFGRVRDWLGRASDGIQTSHLAHGKAFLNDDFRGLVHLGDVIDLYDDPAVMTRGDGTTRGLVTHAWMSGRKKGALASILVGTIDQDLFGALKVKHVALRQLALASKVVVIDEVHASDSYMLEYAHRLVAWLGAYRVPTILLSATLDPALRESLAAAYAGTPPGRNGRRATVRFPEMLEEAAYPLITSVTANGVPQVVRPAASGRSSVMQVEAVQDDDDTLVTLLTEALERGGSAAVIRNTVRRAQDTARMLRERMPHADVEIVHARLVAAHRMRREAALRTRLGPGRPTRADDERPFIVVGTQVLEQSLDIDVDLMVSDLAPIDLILQRVGRLHRHDRDDRPTAVTAPRLVVTGVDWSTSPPTLVAGVDTIYESAATLASLAGLAPHLAGRPLTLPDDVPGLVATAASAAPPMPADWVSAWVEADAATRRARADQRRRAGTYLLPAPSAPTRTLVGLLAAGVGRLDEDSVLGQQQVRDSDASIEVIVLRRVDGELRMLDDLEQYGDARVPEHDEPAFSLALALAGCTIRLPPRFSRSWAIERTINALEKTVYPGWQRSRFLAGQLVLELDERLCGEIDGIPIRYDADLGLLVGTAAEPERMSGACD
ncbi:CRISPR-associated helicase Cas3' [Galbitalea sp. SE-J8]|uniref:CRISPR-associated helicase Cas3' n=1 Tax=Galbitalea sp. SE-J8 TaxID=3054952 RepID=UPI00259CA8DF|nr:CRISPR-associated helicase Cas3' [Galbitalea sp. SE-J8]MDM4762829.1 CRISPR-associated helicase Cas3' [Galbitalea sp. SE-J8]